MALGTATVAANYQRTEVFHDRLSFAGDSAYATGGTAAFEAYVQAALDLGSRDVIAVLPLDCGGYTPVYDVTNDKLKVYYGNTDAADGPMIEVPNATDLSAVTFRVLVLSA